MATNDYIFSNKRFDKSAAATDLFMFFFYHYQKVPSKAMLSEHNLFSLKF